jgi:hypothetical protein
MNKSLSLLTLTTGVLLAAPSLYAQILISNDFSSDPVLVSNNTMPNADTWYVNATRFSYNEATGAVRREAGSPGGFTAFGIAGDAIAVTEDLVLSFTYNMDFTEVTMKIGIYGVLAPDDGFGGGGDRLRTDNGATDGAGSEWQVLQLGTPNLSASGTYSLNWSHTGTDYVNVGLVIGTTNLNAGSGSFFDVNSVTLTQVPEPGTYALLSGLIGLGMVLLRRRR